MAATPLRFPKRLRPGDLVALAAPGGVVDPARAEGAVRLLESRGLRVRVAADITDRCRYLAGDDRRRSRELVDALRSPEVRAVFLARGGYGSQRILADVRPEVLGEPRPVVGFSDNTALLNHMRLRCGWAALHGPHPRVDHPDELDSVLGCLGYYGEPARPAAFGLKLWNSRPWDRVTAEVAGGCLAILASSAGTPCAFSGSGRIVFLEDVGEPVYRLDRMLHQLVVSGGLDGAAAVVFGQLRSFLPSGENPALLDDLLAEFSAEIPFPVLSGISSGHTEPNLPLPFGPRALLDPQRGTLAFLEGLVL